jgi:predicted acylesterase/phospholipase RssA
MADMSGSKQAVILSGGGALGAYAVGVLKALFSGKFPESIGAEPIEPDIFAGTSTGSYNAAFLVGQWDTYGRAAINNLERVWLDEIAEHPERGGNGVYRFRGNPLPFLRPGYLVLHPFQPFIQVVEDSASLYWDLLRRAVYFVTAPDQSLPQRILELLNISSFTSREPLEQLLTRTIRFTDIRTSKKKLRIAATNWAMGRVDFFENADMTDQLGPLVILASSAIPGFFQRASVGSQPYVDGGLLLNTPLKPAIDAGGDILHVIYMDPDVKYIHVAEMDNTVTTMWRAQVIAWAKAVDGDIDSAERTNRAVLFARIALRAVEILGGAEVTGLGVKEFFAETDVHALTAHLERSARYKVVTIHRYHPRDDLGGPLGLLNFQYEKIQYLIERGFQDTVNHDCNDSQCVLPSRA